MGGPKNPAGGKFNLFNFKVKIVQTDLTRPDYFYHAFGAMGGGIRNESPIIYQNSQYISKLFYINNISGGILAKDKVEDMPERYKRFISSANPSALEIAGSFIKEMAELANREEIGQNVFYSSISSAPDLAAAGNHAGLARIFEDIKNGPLAELENHGDFEGFENHEDFEDYEDFEDFEDFEELGELEEFEDYEDYAADEIRDILHLNNYYNSEEFKMSKVEYDFDAPGEISLSEDGSVIIKYDESELTGFSGSYIQLMFRPENKNTVMLRRKGFFDMWLVLEEGKRIPVGSADDNSRNQGADLAANTKELVNNMTLRGGNMRFVYITENNGFPTEMISHSISASPAEKSIKSIKPNKKSQEKKTK